MRRDAGDSRRYNHSHYKHQTSGIHGFVEIGSIEISIEIINTKKYETFQIEATEQNADALRNLGEAATADGFPKGVLCRSWRGCGQ
jgi:hypothetical protein